MDKNKFGSIHGLINERHDIIAVMSTMGKNELITSVMLEVGELVSPKIKTPWYICENCPRSNTDHWGRADSTYPQGSTSCSRLHFCCRLPGRLTGVYVNNAYREEDNTRVYNRSLKALLNSLYIGICPELQNFVQEEHPIPCIFP